MSILSDLPEGSAIAVVRLRSLGDCVLTTPALHVLKTARPDLRISVVVENRWRDVFSGNPDVSQILPPSVRAIRQSRPELCLNLHGGTRSTLLTAASGARLRAGFAHFKNPLVYNLRIPTAQRILGVDRVVHTAEHIASAVFWFGAPVGDVPRACLFARPALESHPIAVIHPIAATPAKTWPPEKFLEVARRIRTQHDLEPVFIAGSGEDLTPFSEFRTEAGSSLEITKSLLSKASLFIGNDSGPAHMAAALAVPSIVLFGPSNPLIWGPWQVESRAFSANPISDINANQVIEAAAALTKELVRR